MIMTNKKGQTFSEFMKEYKKKHYGKVAVTVDNVLFSICDERLSVLLVKRGDFPYIGEWALPGGFLDDDESCEEAAARELYEETGIDGVELEQLYTVSTPNRDPRCKTVSNCFMGVLENPVEAYGDDDVADAQWFAVDFAAKDDLYELVLKGEESLNAVMQIKRCKNGKIDINNSVIISQVGLAFDHAKLILYAIESLN